MPKKILQKNDPVLRKIAEEVPVKQIGSAKIQKVISEMKEALESQDDGVAIAAPQIGYPFRIFVVSRRVEDIIKGKEENFGIEGEEIENKKKIKTSGRDYVYINPSLTKISKKKHVVEEGCLSVRYLYGKVSRSVKASIEAYDEDGKKFTRGASGLLAQIFQHEVDHLDGVLFIDKAKNLQEIPPEK